MRRKKAFLTYVGNRKWRKVRSSKTPAGRDYLRYAGNRTWKRVSSVHDDKTGGSNRIFKTAFRRDSREALLP